MADPLGLRRSRVRSRREPVAPITEKTINAALERARDEISLAVKVRAHVAKHTYCTNWLKEYGKDEFAKEKLSRQIGASVAVLRSTYVHRTLTASDFETFARSGRVGRPVEAEAARSNLAGRMVLSAANLRAGFGPGLRGIWPRRSSALGGCRQLPSSGLAGGHDRLARACCIEVRGAPGPAETPTHPRRRWPRSKAHRAGHDETRRPPSLKAGSRLRRPEGA
jgi:hypothetical protein